MPIELWEVHLETDDFSSHAAVWKLGVGGG
jgi:hypothetical protein